MEQDPGTDSGLPRGEPFGDTAERLAKMREPAPAPVPPAHWGTKTVQGDAWLSGGEPKPVNKARGALFADLIVSDEMIADALMRKE